MLTAVSSLSLIELMAQHEGKRLGFRYLRRLVRREEPMFLLSLVFPPLLANTLIGFALFQTYTLTEALLLLRWHDEQRAQSGASIFTPLGVVFVAGGAAGAAQCAISAPLSNVRVVLQQYMVQDIAADALRAARRRPVLSWATVLKAALLPFLPDFLYRRVRPGMQRTPAERVSRTHGIVLNMRIARDSLGFASFFVVFELARRAAYHTSILVDRLVGALRRTRHAHSAPPTWERNLDVSYNTSRTVYGRVVAAVILVCGGAIGAAVFQLVGRPLDLVRYVVTHAAPGSFARSPPRRAQTPTPPPSVALRPSPAHDRVPRIWRTGNALRTQRARAPPPRKEPERGSRPSGAHRTRLNHAPHPSPPSILSQLLAYARRTAPRQAAASPLRLLVGTYLVRPYARPEQCPRSLAAGWGSWTAPGPSHGRRTRRSAAEPRRVSRVLTLPSAGSVLRRLASPYGCAFLVFAWIGGDLSD